MRSLIAASTAALCAAVLAGCAVSPNHGCVAVIGYCYRTLADVDCYTQPEPNRQPLAVLRQPID